MYKHSLKYMSSNFINRHVRLSMHLDENHHMDGILWNVVSDYIMFNLNLNIRPAKEEKK